MTYFKESNILEETYFCAKNETDILLSRIYIVYYLDIRSYIEIEKENRGLLSSVDMCSGLDAVSNYILY